jgi:hypothetical protein
MNLNYLSNFLFLHLFSILPPAFILKVSPDIKLPFSLSNILKVVPFINLPCFPFINSKSMFTINQIVSLIFFLPSLASPNSVSVSIALFEITFVGRTIYPLIFSITFRKAIYILPFIFISIRKIFMAFSMLQSILKFSIVKITFNSSIQYHCFSDACLDRRVIHPTNHPGSAQFFIFRWEYKQVHTN